MPLTASLRYFSRDEFRAPHLIAQDAAEFLDEVRHVHAKPLLLYSDGRTPDWNTVVGGKPGSLHVLGRAFDFALPATREDLWSLVRAVIHVQEIKGVGVELELVSGPDDKHVHLGVFADARPSRFILALD
jgi:uncharacterized protein YcbK (DUF882 family)